VYNDHISILKFIERNWRLPTVSGISRDNLPNPRRLELRGGANGPAIGDLTSLFIFGEGY
jgi:phospholipase C